MKVLKFAILGCGHIATKMAAAVKTLENKGMGVECYAVASRNLEKADAFAKEYGFKKAYGSYEELASDSAVDLIYIATPHSHHHEFAKLCIDHGRNILVEKAFTANTKLAAEVIALAHDKGVFLCEAMWTRFLPALDTIRGWICENRIGNVETVEADFSMKLSDRERMHNPSLAGGALLDIGIYSLTFADLFLGQRETSDGNFVRNEITSMDCKCIKFETGVDASDWINITYENGQRAYLKTSMVSPTHNEGMIYGTAGQIRVQNLNDMVKLELLDAAGNVVETVEPPRLCNCYEYEVLACKEAIENPAQFRHEICKPCECCDISNGGTTGIAFSKPIVWERPEMTHAKTMEFMTLMDKIREQFGVSYTFEISPGETWNRNGDKSILQVFDIESGEAKILKEFDCVIEAPNWSADGTFLTFNSNGHIFKFEIATGEVTKIESHYVDNCNNDHVLDPDGSGIYVSHHTKEDGLSRIYKIYFDDREPRLVTPLAPSYLHGITPDGKTLAYCAERNGSYDIYMIPAAGGNETRLTTAFGLNDGPEYNGNGEYIWFNSERSGRMQAFCMKADGSEQMQMTYDLHWNTWFPHISPDRQKVVMVAYSESDVRPGEHVPNKNVELRLMRRLSPAGDARENAVENWNSPQTILKLFGGQGTINVNSWAPDSKRFAFVSYIHGDDPSN
jgi:predicted dehydrogenase/Tol biopolymer transport system component